MVHFSKSLAVAAMILAPALAAPVFQAEEIESFERSVDDSDLLEARQGKGRGLAAALAAFSFLSSGVSLATGLSGLGKRDFEDDLLVVRDILDNGDLETRANLGMLLQRIKGYRGLIASSAAGLAGVGLGVGAVLKPERRFFDEYAEYDARDYQDFSDVFERDYYEDAMFEREFFDELD